MILSRPRYGQLERTRGPRAIRPRRAGGSATLLIAGVAALLAAAPIAEANSIMEVNGGLLRQADVVIAGTVAFVEPPGPSGEFLAQIAVDESLVGSAPKGIVLRGSMMDPTLPRWDVGARFIGFLRTNVDPQTQTTTFVPVGTGHGILGLADGEMDAARTMVKGAFGGGPPPSLHEIQPLLGPTKGPATALLLAAVLREVGPSLTKADAPLVATLACDAGGSYARWAHTWAIGRAGALKVAEARPCLETLAVSSGDPDVRLAAAEGLGDLGDPSSVPLLLSFLEPLQGEPSSRPSRRGEMEMTLTAVLALGKIGDRAAVPAFMRIAFEGDDLALHSTVVHALGLIGGNGVIGALTEIGHRHPNDLVRDQALRTLERVRRDIDRKGGVS